MADPLDFLDGDSPVETPVAVEQPAVEASISETPQAEAEAPKGPVRGPDGKFTKADAATAAEAAPQAPAPMPEAVQTAPEQGKPPEGYVPIGVVQELRKEIQAFKAQQQQQPAEPPPDPYEDFEAYQAYQEDQIAGERFHWSLQLLTARHGEETAAKVQQWAAEKAATDPLFYQRALATKDPFGFAFAEFQQAEALQMLADPTLRQRFQAFLSGQAAPPQTAAPVAAPQSPAAPPPSITQAPSSGGIASVPLGQDQIYGAVFG